MKIAKNETLLCIVIATSERVVDARFITTQLVRCHDKEHLLSTRININPSMDK